MGFAGPSDLREERERYIRTMHASYRFGEFLDMSILGKMQHLTEAAAEFTKETEAVLDGVMNKIEQAKKKRDAAADRHHGYYDGIIKSVDESVEAIDRLSNLPLPDDGK